MSGTTYCQCVCTVFMDQDFYQSLWLCPIYNSSFHFCFQPVSCHVLFQGYHSYCQIHFSIISSRLSTWLSFCISGSVDPNSFLYLILLQHSFCWNVDLPSTCNMGCMQNSSRTPSTRKIGERENHAVNSA